MGSDHTIRQKTAEYVLLCFAVATPLVMISAHRAIVPVCAVTAVILLFSIGPRTLFNRFRGSSRTLLVGGVAFIGTLIISMIWAPDPGRGAITVAKVTGSFLMGTILITGAGLISARTAKRTTFAFVGSLLIVAGFLGIDAVTGGVLSLQILGKGVQQYYGHFWLKAAAAMLALGIWPLVLIAWQRGHAWFAGLMIAVSGASAYAIGANGVTVAILGGALVGFVFTVLGRFRKRASIFAFVVFSTCVLLQPVIVKELISPEGVGSELTLNQPIAGSALYRLYIWDFVSDRIYEKPILGWGVGASRNIGDGELAVDPKWGEIGEAVPLHPHNAFLQLYLELGLPGLILSLIPIGVMLWRLAGTGLSAPERFAGTGLLFSILFQYSISFSVWSSWWNVAVLFALTMMVVAWRNRDSSHQTP